MVNFEILPRTIKHNGNWYNLNVHMTAWNKICISYKMVDKWTPENNNIYYLFSNVVESDMNGDIRYSDSPFTIIDVPSFEMGVNIISSRINTAISNNVVELVA